VTMPAPCPARGSSSAADRVPAALQDPDWERRVVRAVDVAAATLAERPFP
jgi:hypothetical protein